MSDTVLYDVTDGVATVTLGDRLSLFARSGLAVSLGRSRGPPRGSPIDNTIRL